MAGPARTDTSGRKFAVYSRSRADAKFNAPHNSKSDEYETYQGSSHLKSEPERKKVAGVSFDSRPRRRVAVVFNPKLQHSQELAGTLSSVIRRGGGTAKTLSSMPTEEDGHSRLMVKKELSDCDLVVTLGGDGTILRAARHAWPARVPILGVNLGELGFLAELSADEAVAKLPAYLEGQGWLEARSVLRVEIAGSRLSPDGQVVDGVHNVKPLIALNDVVISRGALSRVVRVRATIDGARFTTYFGDGVVAATPTGSTAYSLAAGGPILHPESSDILLTPIVPYLTFSYPLVIPGSSAIEFEAYSAVDMLLTIDGQIDMKLIEGQLIRVSVDEHPSIFLRNRPPGYFYKTLVSRLRADRFWMGPDD